MLAPEGRYDFAHFGVLVGLVATVVLESVSVYHGKPFDPQAFGVGLGGLLFGGGFAKWSQR